MKYICAACDIIYDEEEEGVPFNSLPEDWECPLCGVPKGAFVPLKETANT